MKIRALSLALFAATAIAAGVTPITAAGMGTVATQTVNAPDPAEQIEQWARRFRDDDLVGLAEAVLPESRWEQAQAAYELSKLHPVTEDERAAFAEQLRRIAAPDAVDVLMAQIAPKIEEVRPQLPGMLLMAAGALQLAATSPESELDEAQRAALQSAIPGIDAWLHSTDFLDEATLRQALGLVSDAVRGTGIDDLDDVRMLTLEGALERLGPVLAASKRAALLYGVDLNRMADSLQVEVIERGADTARVRTTIDVFGQPVSFEHELALVEGRWYGKHIAFEVRSMPLAAAEVEVAD